MITTEENCTAGTCAPTIAHEAAPEATPIPPQTSAPGPRGPELDSDGDCGPIGWNGDPMGDSRQAPAKDPKPGPRRPKWVEVTFRDLAALAGNPDLLADALRDADAQVIILRCQVAHLEHKLEQAEANGQTLANDLGATLREVEGLKADIRRSEQANLELHLSLGQAHKEIQDMKEAGRRESTELAAAIRSREQENITLRKEAHHLSNQCGTYLRTITQQKETIANLKYQHAATKAQNVGMSRELQKRFTPHEPRPGTSRVEPFGITSPTPEPEPTEPLGSHNHTVCQGCKHAWRSAAVNPGQNGWCYMFIGAPDTGHCSQWMPRHDHRKVGV